MESRTGAENADIDDSGPLQWSAAALAGLTVGGDNSAPIVSAEEAGAVLPGLDVWDSWPLADPQGNPVPWRGGELWFALAVPCESDPEQRHHKARIHHFHRVGCHFTHIGQTLPEGHAPGSREWSGSARYEGGEVTLFFTVTGHAGEAAPTFHQRLFATYTDMAPDGDFGIWSAPYECLRADGLHYRPADQDVGEPGKIKAFRDPAHYRAANGVDYLLFTGSSAAQPSAHDGLVGLAIAEGEGTYRPLPPLVSATGVNNELERPHIVEHQGRLCLFWSTQRGVFAPGIEAPTGLYGATAESLAGPWQLLNGSGLVVANPAQSPTQCYSWWVLPDLTLASFVDYWQALDPSRPEEETRRERFGGTFAPFLKLSIAGTQTRLVR